ncbi:hypothetical protein CRUP_037463, partial [Coryphaenoides rupestris]
MYFKLKPVAAFALGGGGGGGGGWWLLAPSRQEKEKIQTRRAEAPDKNQHTARPDGFPRPGFCSGSRGHEAEPNLWRCCRGNVVTRHDRVAAGGLQHCDGLLFGEAISLDVLFKDDTPHVAPTLFTLHPVNGDVGAPQVCLATGFYPDVSADVVVTGGQQVNTYKAISPKGKSYFFAAIPQGGNIDSCRMKDTYPTTHPVALNPTADQARLNWYWLLTDSLRLIFTKTLALNMLLVARG